MKYRDQAIKQGQGQAHSFRRLVVTMVAICFPIFAATFFGGSFLKLGTVDAASAHGHSNQPDVAVSITNGGFNPNSITINPGTQVTWTNNTSDRVRVRDSEHNLFDSGDINPGRSFSYTFVTSGIIGVDEERNEFHMTVHVTGSTTGTPGGTGTAQVTRTGTAQTTGTAQATGTAGGPTNTPSGGSLVIVNIVSEDFPGYDPANVTIQSGTRVRWVNVHDDEHTTTSPGNWDSGEMEEGATFETTLIVNGTYNYFCAFHEDMQGSVTVVGGPSPTPMQTPTIVSGNLNVDILNFAFVPQHASVQVGTTVRWTNRDSAPHTATSPGNFDSGNLGQGQSYQFTFNTPGTFNYFCAVHPGMTGSITVGTGGGGGTPTAQVSPTAQTPQPTNTPVSGGTVNVAIQNFVYAPQHVTINPGTTVRWTNQDSYPHTATSPGNFDSGNLNQGQSYQFTFNTPGTFNYFCALHPSMTGSVTVLGGGGSTPTTQPTQPLPTQTRTTLPTGTAQPTGTTQPTPVPQVHSVNIIELNYRPVELRIRVGDAVRWTNSDSFAHTATSPGNFDSGNLDQGQTYQFTFTTAGTYEYFCALHPPQWMPPGRIIVEAPQPPAPTATRAPGQIFSDVNSTDYFYAPVNHLVSRGIVSGYSDGTFRPYNNTTRSQVTKMVVLGEGWALANPQTPTFRDVPRDNAFYSYIETAVQHGIISGYADGTFRPFNDVTRGQITKIVVLARNWSLANPATSTFSDVPVGSTFFQHVETAVQHQVLGGYADGTFRPTNNATRGQVAKIIYNALTGGQ